MADFEGSRPFITIRFNVVLTVAAFICGYIDWITDPIYEKAPSRLTRAFADSPVTGFILLVLLLVVGMAIAGFAIHQFWLRFVVGRFNLRPITLAESYAIVTVASML